jgi:hypothetical protein
LPGREAAGEEVTTVFWYVDSSYAEILRRHDELLERAARARLLIRVRTENARARRNSPGQQSEATRQLRGLARP